MQSFIAAMLERLLMASAQAALLAAVVWLLCRYLPRLSPATQCWLWWLVALQVLLGLCVGPIRLAWLPQAPAAAAVATTLDLSPLPVGAMAMPAALHGPPPWQSALLLLWVSGFAVMCMVTLRDWRRTRQLLRNSAQCVDAGVLRIAAEVASLRGARAAPLLRISGDIESPLVLGHFRPVLLLPAATSLRTAELEMAVAHELQHLRRADLWWGLVPALARHCFFFHPLMHLAVREYGIAREAACDAAVVAAGQRSRHEYGELLVRLGTATGASTGLAAASSTFRALSRRLVFLQHASFLPRTGASAVLILALAGVMPLRLVAAADVVVVPAILTSDTAMPPSAGAVGEMRPAEVTRSPPAAKPRARAVRVATAPAVVDSTATLEQQRIEFLARLEQVDAAQQAERAARLAEEKALAEANLYRARAGMEAIRADLLRAGAPAQDQTPAQERLVRYQAQLAELEATLARANKQAEDFRARSAQLFQAQLSQAQVSFMPDLRDYYPSASLALGEEGTVRLRLCYNENGKVTESTVSQSSGFARLDESAVRVGKAVRIMPAVVAGTAQAGCLVIPLRYSAASQQAQSAPAVQYTGERMTVDFQDIATSTLLQVISETSGRTIVVDQSVAGSVTMRINNMPWDHVLDIVLRTKHLEKRVQGNEIVVATAAAFAAMDRAAGSATR